MNTRDWMKQKHEKMAEFFADVSPQDLAELKRDAGERTAFSSEGARQMFARLPVTHGWVKRVIFEHVTGGSASPAPSKAPRAMATVGAVQEFEV